MDVFSFVRTGFSEISEMPSDCVQKIITSTKLQANVTWNWCLVYLCASEGFHFAVLNTCRSFADIHGVVKEGLIFGGKLLWPLPNCREKPSRVFSWRDGFVFGKVLKSKKDISHAAFWRLFLQNKMKCCWVYLFFKENLGGIMSFVAFWLIKIRLTQYLLVSILLLFFYRQELSPLLRRIKEESAEQWDPHAITQHCQICLCELKRSWILVHHLPYAVQEQCEQRALHTTGNNRKQHITTHPREIWRTASCN